MYFSLRTVVVDIREPVASYLKSSLQDFRPTETFGTKAIFAIIYMRFSVMVRPL
jgi:hypothetical protein